MKFSSTDACKAAIAKFERIRKENLLFNKIITELLAEKGRRKDRKVDVYVVGGFIRDAYYKKNSRDIDLMVDMENRRLHDFIDRSRCIYTINRHGGMKLYVDSIIVDIWTLEENWAFRSNSVIQREDAMLASIALGCFYNYDSLVLRLTDGRYNFKNFEKFCVSRELDILEGANYQARNPMLEANILRAYYIKKKYSAFFSQRVKKYIFEEIVNLDLMGYDVWNRIAHYRNNYPKYKILDINHLKLEVQNLIREITIQEPYLFDISHLLT